MASSADALNTTPYVCAKCQTTTGEMVLVPMGRKKNRTRLCLNCCPERFLVELTEDLPTN